MGIAQLTNPRILEINPYVPGKPVEEIEREFGLKRVIKLASNENFLPIPANVRQAIRQEMAQIHFYPDSDNFYLRQRIAAHNGVDFAQVTVGAGSVELIRMIIVCFLRSGQKVLTSEKTFSLYEICTTEIAGKKAFCAVPMDSELRFDLEAIRGRMDESVGIIFLTNPNNPTGTMLPKAAMLDFIRRVPDHVIVVLDNAYQEYVDDPGDHLDGIDLVRSRPNVIILRTFSKIYGLAGLRVGYAISNPEIIAILNRVKAPFSVTRVSQRAALAALENDEYTKKSRRLNRIHKAWLLARLRELGLRVIPSQTNFLLFFPGVDVAELNRRLMRQGVIVRPTGGFGVPDAIRVTVGSRSDNDFFIRKLKASLAEMRG